MGKEPVNTGALLVFPHSPRTTHSPRPSCSLLTAHCSLSREDGDALAEERTPEPTKKEEPKEAYEYYLSRPPELEPDHFEEGFTVKTVMGALFVGLIMMPGSIYLGLLVG